MDGGPMANATVTSAALFGRQQAGAPRILVIEDEESYREALEAGLTKEGFEVELAADGSEGLRRFTADPPDLVLLDLMLPGMTGTEVCRRMCQTAPVPVIMVTALDAEVEVVYGFELGAADYVTKPYRFRELVARIQAVLRRKYGPELPALLPEDPGFGRVETVTAGPVVMNLTRREVTYRGSLIYLSRREFDLLALLLMPPGQVRTRDEIIDRLWSGLELTDTRTLDTHIRRLRLKLEEDPADPVHLVTVRGVGFRFDDEGRRAAVSPV
jgi:two-component system, OmpR family, response regulator RegX3